MLNWADGESGTKDVVIPILDAGITETLKLLVNLSNVVGAAAPVTAQAEGFIEVKPA